MKTELRSPCTLWKLPDNADIFQDVIQQPRKPMFEFIIVRSPGR